MGYLRRHRVMFLVEVLLEGMNDGTYYKRGEGRKTVKMQFPAASCFFPKEPDAV